MINVILKEGTPELPVWLDVADPTPEELYGLADNYQLHPKLVQDCLDPAHLPKIERHGDTTFIIVRHYDEASDVNADTVRGMTSKLALFIGDRFLITVHRRRQQFLEPFMDQHRKAGKPIYLQTILLDMLKSAIETYHKPLESIEDQIHGFETSILKGGQVHENWAEIFQTKSRLTIVKRILWHTLDTVQKFVPYSESSLPLRQDVCERIESLRFFADSLLDDLTALLNIQLSLATHRANDASQRINHVMKVLTLFSAFFLPLNFIVGIYGMNFVHMPEIQFKYGYLAIWIVLIVTFVSIYAWFVRKGWIRWGHLS